MPKVVKIPGQEKSYRIVVDELTRGRFTRSFPHLIPDQACYVLDNFVLNRDGILSKRPGNAYLGGTGITGSGSPSLAGARFRPGATAAPQLLVHSGTQLWRMNDTTGASVSVGTGLASTRGAFFARMRDPDMTSGNAVALFVTDGVSIPKVYDGVNFVPVQTGGQFLPNGVVTGTPITPKYCLSWREHLVYAGDPNDPTAIWISDALRPERFNGYSLSDSGGVNYTPYYPGGSDTALGPITGLGQLGPYLVVLYESGLVSGINTGTYGAFQYQFQVISANTGMTSERSFVPFEGFGIFFGGDRFYATDGQSVVPLPDDVPDVYANGSNSVFPSEMIGKTGVAAGRRGTQYWASYDTVGTGRQTVLAVFDTSVNVGYSFGAKEGGAWLRWPTGMPLSWMLEAKDNFQTYWGLSNADRVAVHDNGLSSDFALDIQCEVRCKAFFLDAPINPKSSTKVYPLLAYQTQGASFTDSVSPYVTLDSSTTGAPTIAPFIARAGVGYGTMAYGSFAYGASQQIIFLAPPAFPQREYISLAVQPGLTETSSSPFNMIGFVLEVTVDEPNL